VRREQWGRLVSLRREDAGAWWRTGLRCNEPDEGSETGRTRNDPKTRGDAVARAVAEKNERPGSPNALVGGVQGRKVICDRSAEETDAA
jgi:hypothetical protein